MSTPKQADPVKDVVVVGAGIGGVAIAARLAKAGFNVTVVEKNDYVGGRCSLLHHDGYRFDQGPSLLLLPGMFEEFFQEMGTSLSAEGIKLQKCSPNYNIWFHDGASFELSPDLASMKQEIERWEGKAGFMRYLSFLQEAHQHYEASVLHVLHRNFSNYLSMFRWGFLSNLLALHPFESIYSRASKYFWTERLRRVFTFGSMYMGMSPYEAPGTYSLLQYTELAEGIWYPEGGFYRIPKTIADVSQRYGVTYRLNTSVESITTDSSNTRTTGVILSDGSTLNASTVVCNADLVYAYNNLLPRTSYAESLSARPGSCSSISFYWALDTTIPQLKAHNIFLAEKYKESFDQIFHDQSLPSEPSFYVNVPSRVDPTAAPPGKDTVVVLCPVGHLLSSESSTPGSFFTWGRKRGLCPENEAEWEQLVTRARDAVLGTIQSRLRISLREHIIHEQLNTPSTWQSRFNLDKGAILGLSHSFFNVLCFRPATKHASINGLYFCGASTHPGTGVPIVLAGSRLVADQVLEDKAREVGGTAGKQQYRKPWGEWNAQAYERYGASWRGNQAANGKVLDKSETASWLREKNRAREKTLDTVKMSPMMSWIHTVVLAMLAVLLIAWREKG